MGRRATTVAAAAACSVLLLPGAALACGGLVGENGSIELLRTTTLAAWNDGVEHYVTAFEFTGDGRVGRVDHPAARRADRRGARPATGRCSGCALEVAPAERRRASRRRRRRGAPQPEVEILLETEIDALDITVLARRRRRGRPVGARERLLPHARRPRDARLLRRAQPDLHGRQVRRRRAPPSSGQGAGDGTPDHGTIPTRPARGCRCGSSASGSRPTSPCEADVFLLTDERARAARRRPRPRRRAQRAGVEPPARRPPLRRRHGVGARRACG